jgi:hypothetical protein
MQKETLLENQNKTITTVSFHHYIKEMLKGVWLVRNMKILRDELWNV